jgi:hypothetical protein
MKQELYYCNFNGKHVELRAEDRRLVRKFTMQSKVVNAQVTGAGQNATVAITMENGKTYLYKADGRLVRR